MQALTMEAEISEREIIWFIVDGLGDTAAMFFLYPGKRSCYTEDHDRRLR